VDFAYLPTAMVSPETSVLVLRRMVTSIRGTRHITFLVTRRGAPMLTDDLILTRTGTNSASLSPRDFKRYFLCSPTKDYIT